MRRGFLARLSSRLAALLRRVAKALERLTGIRDDGVAELAVRFPNAPEHWLRDIAALADDPAKLPLIAAGERRPPPVVRPAVPRRPTARTLDAPPSRPVAEKPPRPILRVLPARLRNVAGVPSSPVPHEREAPVDDVQSRERMGRPKETQPLETERRTAHREENPPPVKRRPRLTVVTPANERARPRAGNEPDEHGSDLRVRTAEQELERRHEARPVEPPAPQARPARSVLAYVRAVLKRVPRPALAGRRARLAKRLAEAGLTKQPVKAKRGRAPEAAPVPRREQAIEAAPVARAVPPDAFAPPSRPTKIAADAARARDGHAAHHGSGGRWPALPDDDAPDSHIEPPRLSELRREQEHGLWSA